MASLFGLFKKEQKPKKDLKQDDIINQTKTALVQSCKICSNYGSEKITFGDDVQPTLTCKRCELKALDNDSSKLGTSLISIDKFAQTLGKEARVYYLQKSNPNNLSKINIGQVTEAIKTTEGQIGQIKEAYKQLQTKTQKKLEQLVTISTSCNKVSIFDSINKLATDKKLEEVGNGNIFLKETIVDNTLHFFNKDEMEEDNKKVAKRLTKCVENCEVTLDELSELIDEINKLVL